MEVPAALGRSYAKPRAITDDEIKHTIAQFAAAARVVKQAGFTGVHVHGAHGYLMSQFLSARSNTRTDRWGGSLEKRARFLLETITAIRAAVGPGFPIGLKLNSSAFMKGGFTKADAIQVVGWRNSKGLDLLELSGGSVEQRFNVSGFAHVGLLEHGLAPGLSDKLNDLLALCGIPVANH